MLLLPVGHVKYLRYSVAASLDSGKGTPGSDTLWQKAVKWQQEYWGLVLAGAAVVMSIVTPSEIRLSDAIGVPSR